jgi:cytochrome c-type biogenesis protein CcmE
MDLTISYLSTVPSTAERDNYFKENQRYTGVVSEVSFVRSVSTITFQFKVEIIAVRKLKPLPSTNKDGVLQSSTSMSACAH